MIEASNMNPLIALTQHGAVNCNRLFAANNGYLKPKLEGPGFFHTKVSVIVVWLSEDDMG